MKKRKLELLITFLLLLTFSTSCQSINATGQTQLKMVDNPDVPLSILSYGMVKKLLQKGVTTQADVLKQFGSPNNMTIDSTGHELWIYDHVSTESSLQSQSESSGLGIGLGNSTNGTVAGAVAGGTSSNSSVSSISSTRTLTVILEFDKNILMDYSARTGGY